MFIMLHYFLNIVYQSDDKKTSKFKKKIKNIGIHDVQKLFSAREFAPNCTTEWKHIQIGTTYT